MPRALRRRINVYGVYSRYTPSLGRFDLTNRSPSLASRLSLSACHSIPVVPRTSRDESERGTHTLGYCARFRAPSVKPRFCDWEMHSPSSVAVGSLPRCAACLRFHVFRARIAIENGLEKPRKAYLCQWARLKIIRTDDRLTRVTRRDRFFGNLEFREIIFRASGYFLDASFLQGNKFFLLKHSGEI